MFATVSKRLAKANQAKNNFILLFERIKIGSATWNYNN